MGLLSFVDLTQTAIGWIRTIGKHLRIDRNCISALCEPCRFIGGKYHCAGGNTQVAGERLRYADGDN